jgi:hypothetical protein
MTTSPADLAVAFRSVARRLREAQGDAPAEAVSGPAGGITELIADAARVLRCPADGSAVAVAIEARHADDWTNADLERLGAIALDIGRRLREVEAARPPNDD